MPEARRVLVFAEDRATEQYALALLSRLAAEVGLLLSLDAVTAQGGAGPTMTHLRQFQRLRQRRGAAEGVDLGVVILDADQHGWAKTRQSILATVDPSVFPLVAVGCPDPHVERWYLADRGASQQTYAVADLAPLTGRPPDYKRVILETLQAAGDALPRQYPSAAERLVRATDLERAGREVPELDHFIKDLRACLRRLAS